MVIRPVEDIVTGQWGVSPLFSKIDESTPDDNDFISSSIRPSLDGCAIKLGEVTTIPNVRQDHVLRYRYNHTTTGAKVPIDLIINLVEGTGAGDARVIHTERIPSLPTGFTSGFVRLPYDEARFITGYNKLATVFTADMDSLNYGLVAHWTLDETGGTRYDSVQGINLTDENTVGFESGKIGHCAKFTYPNAERLTSIDPKLNLDNKSWSYSLWYKFPPVDSDTNGTIIGQLGGSSPGAISEYSSPGSLLFEIYNSNILGQYMWSSYNGNIELDKWFHIYFYYDKTRQMGGYYISGIYIYEQPITGIYVNQLVPELPFAIGGRSSDTWPGYYCSGSVDEVSRWDRVLSSGEIKKLYNYGLGRKYPFVTQTLMNGLKHYWTMDETGYLKKDSIGECHLKSNIFCQYYSGMIGGCASGNKTRYFAPENYYVNPNSGSFTMTAWLYPTVTGKVNLDQRILSHITTNVGGFRLQMDPAGDQFTLACRYWGDYMGMSFPPERPTGTFLNTWQFVTFGYDHTIKKIFASLSGVAPTTLFRANILDYDAEFISNCDNEAFSCCAGATAASLYDFSGFVDEVGFWNRALTDAEISGLYNVGRGHRPYQYTDLHSGLVSYWKMGETGGIRYDYYSENHLMDQNTCQRSVSGIDGNSAILEIPTDENLICYFPLHQSPQRKSITIAGWVNYLNLNSGDLHNIYPFAFTNIIDDPKFFFKTGPDNVYVVTYRNDDSSNFLLIKEPTNMLYKKWNFMALSYNRETSGVMGYVNGYYQTGFIVTDLLTYSGLVFGHYSQYTTGTISCDEFGYWNRALSVKELNYLYNNGAGRFYPFN